MEKIISRSLGLAIILGAILLTALLLTQKSFGSAPSGLPATMATTSQFAVTATQQLVFATSTACATRVITTRAQPVMISFSDVQGFTPTVVLGHLQSASTTVAYDSGQYGCSALRIISATTIADNITVSESR